MGWGGNRGWEDLLEAVHPFCWRFCPLPKGFCLVSFSGPDRPILVYIRIPWRITFGLLFVPSVIVENGRSDASSFLCKHSSVIQASSVQGRILLFSGPSAQLIGLSGYFQAVWCSKWKILKIWWAYCLFSIPVLMCKRKSSVNLAQIIIFLPYF